MLAAFALRPGGLTYANVCARWGVDPAAGFSDDVLAYNFRAALALRLTEQEQEAQTETPDPFAAAREAAARVKALAG